MNRSAIIPR